MMVCRSATLSEMYAKKLISLNMSFMSRKVLRRENKMKRFSTRSVDPTKKL
jgi:hypothetical protein